MRLERPTRNIFIQGAMVVFGCWKLERNKRNWFRNKGWVELAFHEF